MPKKAVKPSAGGETPALGGTSRRASEAALKGHVLKCGRCGREELHAVDVVAFEHSNCESARITNLLTDLTQARIDIRNLLSELEAHQENTGEYLEDEDAAVVAEIKSRWSKAASEALASFEIQGVCAGLKQAPTERARVAIGLSEVFPLVVRVWISRDGICRACGRMHYQIHPSSLAMIERAFGFERTIGPRFICESAGRFLPPESSLASAPTKAATQTDAEGLKKAGA